MGQNTAATKTFGERLIKWLDEDVVGVAAKVRNDIAIEVLAETFRRIPVKTGHARKNIQVSLSGPYVSEIPGVEPRGMATFRREAAKLMKAPFDADVWITNGVPYARRLEEGWSKQAPSGWLAISIATVKARYRR